MLTSKERSRLLAIANSLQTTVYLGKNGVTDAFLAQVDEMLDDHELVKIGVQKSADMTAKDYINYLAETLNAEPVHAIGSKIILFRVSLKDGIKHIQYKDNR